MPFHHLGSVLLESERLILRRFTIEDAPAMFKWASDEKTTEYMRFTTHKSVKESEEIISLWVNDYSRPDSYQWAIVFKERNEVIGSIGFVDFNEFHKQVDVGYIIRKDYWGRGIMTEALRRLIQFGFDDLGLQRIESLHSIENPASGRVMMKSGMIAEGTKRHYFPTDHGFVDCPMYAITREDYNSSPKWSVYSKEVMSLVLSRMCQQRSRIIYITRFSFPHRLWTPYYPQ